MVKAKGAFLHNVMPLIAEAEHGTFYGLMGQRGPTPQELKDLQDACAGDMNMMRHCRQCRADAVGLLGEDRGARIHHGQDRGHGNRLRRRRWSSAPRCTPRSPRELEIKEQDRRQAQAKAALVAMQRLKKTPPTPARC